MTATKVILELVNDLTAEQVGKVIGQLQEVQDQKIHFELKTGILCQDVKDQDHPHLEEKEIIK